VHSCGSEERVTAELNIDSNDVTLTEVKVKLKVKVSIPVDYSMDVYVAPQDNAVSVGGRLHSILSPVSILMQSLALRALRKRKPQETQALALASSQSWLPLLRPSIPYWLALAFVA